MRLGGRRLLLGVVLRMLLARDWGVRTGRGSSMPVVRDIVQLRPLGIHVWLLVPMLLVFRLLRLAELLSILLGRGRGMAKARSERGVLLVVRRLRLAPLLGRIGLSGEGGVDSVARPGGHESGVDEV